MLDLADYTKLWNHSVAWGIYLAAAFVFLLACLQLTRRWRAAVRWPLFVLLAVFLFVPAPVPGGKLSAPAMIMLALSPFTGSHQAIDHALARVILWGVGVGVLAIVVVVSRHLRLRHR